MTTTQATGGPGQALQKVENDQRQQPDSEPEARVDHREQKSSVTARPQRTEP